MTNRKRARATEHRTCHFSTQKYQVFFVSRLLIWFIDVLTCSGKSTSLSVSFGVNCLLSRRGKFLFWNVVTKVQQLDFFDIFGFETVFLIKLEWRLEGLSVASMSGMSSGPSQSTQADTSLWLHNKLGTTLTARCAVTIRSALSAT